MGEDHQGSHPREGGGWDPGTLNSVEFVSSVHTSTPARGEVRAREWRGRPPPQGLLWGQAAAVGAEAQSPAGLPHTVPLCPPTAPVFNQKLRVFEQGGRRRQTCLPGQPPWAAAVLPGAAWASAHTHLGWAVSAGPPWPRWMSLDLVPKGLWSGSSPHAPHSPPEPGDCALTAWLSGQRVSGAFLPRVGLPRHGLWILGKAAPGEGGRPLPTESKMKGVWLHLQREAQQK